MATALASVEGGHQAGAGQDGSASPSPTPVRPGLVPASLSGPLVWIRRPGGGGVGTLSRRFPDRDALIWATAHECRSPWLLLCGQGEVEVGPVSISIDPYRLAWDRNNGRHTKASSNTRDGSASTRSPVDTEPTHRYRSVMPVMLRDHSFRGVRQRARPWPCHPHSSPEAFLCGYSA